MKSEMYSKIELSTCHVKSRKTVSNFAMKDENNLKEIMGGDFKNIPCDIQEKYISKLKLIPFSSLGKQNGMLIGIRPEYVKVITDEQEKINKNVIIGIYEKSLTKKGEYQALIGIELL